MKKQEIHLILGTGPLGLAIMDQLLVQGHSIYMVNRTGKADVPANVNVIACNLLTDVPLDIMRHSR